MTALLTTIAPTLLIPGCAEQLKQAANRDGNLAYYGLAQDIIFVRDTFYAGVATTIIGSLGSAYSASPDQSTACYTYLALAGLGVWVTALTAKKLFDHGLLLTGLVQANRERVTYENTLHAR